MGGENPHVGHLTYALPARPEDGTHVHRESDAVRFELGPIPTEIFVTSLIAQALLFIILSASLLASSFPYRSAVTWALVAFWGVELVVTVIRIACHRLTPRVVGATPEHVFYSGPTTGGKVVTLPRAGLESIGVRRSWWRPWVFELVAVSKAPQFWTLKSTASRGPLVLLLDLDHAVVSRLAMELRDVPAAPLPALSSE